MRPSNNPNGRPKKYTDEFIANEAVEFEKWIAKSDNIYVKRFALERGYDANRLYDFEKVSEEFAALLSMARQWQEIRIVEGSLNNKLNPYFAKFVMVNCHNWKDKQDENLTTNNTYYVNYDKDGNTQHVLPEAISTPDTQGARSGQEEGCVGCP